MIELNKILHGDAFEMLKTLPDKSINCCVTSPPYFNLRDYGIDGQLGLESSPEAFILRLVEIFREVKRVLNDDGTIWVNMGDTYNANFRGTNTNFENSKQGTNKGTSDFVNKKRQAIDGIKQKDLLGIPWMLAFALRADGWYLRQDIIWSKPNPMPESVTDRCTKSHEYLFMLSKRPKYYYDFNAIKTPAKNPIDDMRRKEKSLETHKTAPDKLRNGIRVDKQRGHARKHAGFNERWDSMSLSEQQSMGANKRSVWEIATKPFSEAHFATFPPELIVDCIKAGCPVGGVVLDPFFGAGTTGVVARKLGRNFIGIELNEKYINEIALPRLEKELGLFL